MFHLTRIITFVGFNVQTVSVVRRNVWGVDNEDRQHANPTIGGKASKGLICGSDRREHAQCSSITDIKCSIASIGVGPFQRPNDHATPIQKIRDVLSVHPYIACRSHLAGWTDRLGRIMRGDASRSLRSQRCRRRSNPARNLTSLSAIDPRLSHHKRGVVL